MSIFFILTIFWILYLFIFIICFSSIIHPEINIRMKKIDDYLFDKFDKIFQLYFSLFKKTQLYTIGRFLVLPISIFWLILGVFICLIDIILFIMMLIVLIIVGVFYSIIGFKNYVVGENNE
jgi:hypothetical protein